MIGGGPSPELDDGGGPGRCQHSRRVTDIGDTQFHKGQPVWVLEPDGSGWPAEYVGEGETSAWFGGPPTVFVIDVRTRTGSAVTVDRVVAREGDGPGEAA